MSSIIVEDVEVRRRQRPDPSDPAAQQGGADPRVGLHELEPGRVLRFGRGAPDAAVDMVIASPGVSRYAGEIRAVDNYWLLTNCSRNSTYVVENLEGAGEHVKVSPRRVDAPILFELARILLPMQGGTYPLHVYAPQHAFLEQEGPRHGDATTRPFSLDESSKYFQVLVALCEPRLRDSSSLQIPSSDHVADRLATGESRVTRSAVDYHIDYLAETKLRIKRPGQGSGERLEWKRESLVALALRFDLVREEHLALLPNRTVSRTEQPGREGEHG